MAPKIRAARDLTDPSRLRNALRVLRRRGTYRDHDGRYTVDRDSCVQYPGCSLSRAAGRLYTARQLQALSRVQDAAVADGWRADDWEQWLSERTIYAA